MRPELVTYVLLCLTIMIDKADQGLLPAVYLEVCDEFGLGPSMLGVVTFWRGIVQSLVAVVVGPLSQRFDRVRLAACGCALWGAASALVGAARSGQALLLARAFNGVGIGLVIPLVNSLVSDLAPTDLRGRAFGLLAFFDSVGGAGGALLATELAGADARFGWRLAFHLVALVSGVVALLLVAFARDPRSAARSSQPQGTTLSLAGALADASRVLRIPTFVVIVARASLALDPSGCLLAIGLAAAEPSASRGSWRAQRALWVRCRGIR
jgi:MFS family permease